MTCYCSKIFILCISASDYRGKPLIFCIEPFLVPVVDAQCDQNTDDHQENFTGGIDQVFGKPVFRKQFVPDPAKEFYHWVLILIDYMLLWKLGS